MSPASNGGRIRTRDGAITDEGFIPEWELHPEKFRYYVVGNPGTRFAITKAPYWAWPWQQRPRGGVVVGRLLFWWSL